MDRKTLIAKVIQKLSKDIPKGWSEETSAKYLKEEGDILPKYGTSEYYQYMLNFIQQELKKYPYKSPENAYNDVERKWNVKFNKRDREELEHILIDNAASYYERFVER